MIEISIEKDVSVTIEISIEIEISAPLPDGRRTGRRIRLGPPRWLL